MSRSVLVATDGTPAALGALRFAAELAKGDRCQVEVVGVVEPVPVFDAGFMVALPEVELFESRREALRSEIEGQLRDVTGRSTTFPISVQSGLPAPRIVKQAEEIGADTILMGLGRHGPMDRVFGTETVLQVLRVSHLPILAVPEDLECLPRSAVLGVDFSQFSQRAARGALAFMGTPRELHLVHVLSGMEFLPALSEEWRGDFEGELEERLDEFSEVLKGPPGCESHLHVLEGEPAHEILAFAKARGAELLVAGSHGHSFVGRLLMGSVSTRLVRASAAAVLVVPPFERSEEVLSEMEKEGSLAEWVQELNQFTKGNAGRRTTLELDDPEFGKRECGRNFPLWGVDYDPKRDRVDIMLGHSGTVDGHLTHSLPAPQEIEIFRGADGRTEALQIRFLQGMATLKIHRD